MRKILMAFVFFTIFAALLMILSCSSIPDFKPSRPVEEASSVPEALEICNEYQLKSDKNDQKNESASMPGDFARVVVLVPWLRCFESVFRKFPEARDEEEFVMFFRALQSRHDGALPGALAIDRFAMDAAVHKSMTRLVARIRRKMAKFDQGENGFFSEDERRILSQQLPDYAMYLAEHGGFYKPPAPRARSSAALARLKAGGEPLPPRALPLSREQREYCKKFRQHQSVLFNITELESYEQALIEQTRGDAGNLTENMTKTRLRGRLNALRQEEKEQALALNAQKERIVSQSAWFRDGYCWGEK